MQKEEKSNLNDKISNFQNWIHHLPLPIKANFIRMPFDG